MQFVNYLIYCFITLVVLTASYYGLFCLQFDAPIHAEYWVHDEVVLKHALAKKIHSPKIIVMGGSNGLYGINSRLLSENLQKPVINLSVYGGLPLEWLLYEINRVARPGDIVILPLEWEYYTVGPKAHAGSLLKQIIAWDKDYFYSLNMRERIRLIASEHYTDMINVLLRKWHREKILHKHPEKIVSGERDLLIKYTAGPKPTVFSLNYLNTDSQGDILNTCQGGPKKLSLLETSTYTLDLPPLTANFKALSKGLRQLEKKGIITFVTFPPMYKNEHVATVRSQRNLAKIIGQLSAEHIKLLGQPKDYLFDKKDFFDTHYHLRCEARDRRTLKMIGFFQAHHQTQYRLASK